MKQPYTGLWVP